MRRLRVDDGGYGGKLVNFEQPFDLYPREIRIVVQFVFDQDGLETNFRDFVKLANIFQKT